MHNTSRDLMISPPQRNIRLSLIQRPKPQRIHHRQRPRIHRKDIPQNPANTRCRALIRFDLDTEHKSYDAEYAHRFWRVLVQAEKVFRGWGTDFLGKVSPVHFFWGSFDLAVTRFSGRPAPPREGVDSIQREAYSHEVISAGFWPGNGGYGAAAFYCYASPVPEGLAEVKVRPDTAGWDKALGEFIFKYDAVRVQVSPETALMEFLKSAYGAAADVARWDRAALERR